MIDQLEDYIEKLPKINENLSNVVKFRKHLTQGLDKLEAKINLKNYSKEDKFLLHVYGKYIINLLLEYRDLRREGKLKDYSFDKDTLVFFKRVYKVQGQLMHFYSESQDLEQKYAYIWWSNICYKKSARLAELENDLVHVAKMNAQITKNWLEIYENNLSKGRYLNHAKKSFLKMLEINEIENNKSVSRDIEQILVSSKDLEITLLIDGSISRR